MILEKSNYLKDNKKLMKEYNYEKNKQFDLDTLKLGSDKKILWQIIKKSLLGFFLIDICLV